jgi:hypothetical protein
VYIKVVIVANRVDMNLYHHIYSGIVVLDTIYSVLGVIIIAINPLLDYHHKSILPEFFLGVSLENGKAKIAGGTPNRSGMGYLIRYFEVFGILCR